MSRPAALLERLITAAESGDIDQVRDALAKGADVNGRGPNSYALHCAAFNGHLEIVHALLEAGAAIDQADAQGLFPLHLAVSKGHAEIVELLLARGAAVDARTPAGGTALHVAAAYGFVELGSTLIDAGALVDARDANQRTPAIEAALGGHRDFVELLLAGGAELGARDQGGVTALLAALGRAQSCRIESWSTSGEIQGEPVSYQIEQGMFTMTRAGVTRALELYEQRQIAALWWAPDQLRLGLEAADLALALLELGADPHARVRGNTALHMAAKLGDPRVIEVLLVKVDPTTRNDDGALPLHLAAGSKRPDGLALLLAASADRVNAQDDYGWTPLHYLCDVGGPERMFELLLGAGADPTIASTQTRGGNLAVGSKPIDVARHWNDADAVALLSA